MPGKVWLGKALFTIQFPLLLLRREMTEKWLVCQHYCCFIPISLLEREKSILLSFKSVSSATMNIHNSKLRDFWVIIYLFKFLLFCCPAIYIWRNFNFVPLAFSLGAVHCPADCESC